MIESKQFKISVIVPIYNAENYLKKCIDSIVNQTYSNLEIILIDDGSTDSSSQIIDEFALMDSRIISVHQPNKGLVRTRKTGMKLASGNYVTFVDADDYLSYDAYELIVKKIDSTMPDVIACEMIEEYPDCRIVRKNLYDEGIYSEDMKYIYSSMLYSGNFFEFGIIPNIWNKFFRKDFIKNTKVYVSDKIFYGEDVDFVFQYIAQAKSLQIISQASYYYCKREGTMVWTPIEYSSIKTLESDLKKGFMNAGIWNIMEKQVGAYIKFISLLKAPANVSEVSDIFNKSNVRIALYGAGGFGKALYSQYSDMITVWVDKKTNIDPVATLVEKQNEYDIVFIAILNSKLCEKISLQIKEQIMVEIKYIDD